MQSSAHAVSLDPADVELLLNDPSAANRAQTAGKVARQLDSGLLTETERKLAEDIVRKLTRDAEILVRQILSNALKDCPDVPHDVALTIAKDVAEVAVPMVECSPVLGEADLLEIIREQATEHHKAVARRQHVPQAVSSALVDTGNADVVTELVANNGAELDSQTLDLILGNFSGQPAIRETVARRVSLPMPITERLVATVADNVLDHLITHQELPAGVASDLVRQSRERVTLGYLHAQSEDRNTEGLVEQLRQSGRLTPTIVLRALCLGDLPFFELCLAAIAGIPEDNVRKLLLDQGGMGLTALHRHCGLPEKWLRVVRIAVGVAKDQRLFECASINEQQRDDFRDRLTDEVLEQIEDKFDGNILEFLVARPVEEIAMPKSA